MASVCPFGTAAASLLRGSWLRQTPGYAINRLQLAGCYRGANAQPRPPCYVGGHMISLSLQHNAGLSASA